MRENLYYNPDRIREPNYSKRVKLVMLLLALISIFVIGNILTNNLKGITSIQSIGLLFEGAVLIWMGAFGFWLAIEQRINQVVDK